MAVKKRSKKGESKSKRVIVRKELAIQWHTDFGPDSITFVNKPLSNIDLLQWIKKLGIKYFRGVYSRDNLPNNIMKKDCGIINLDTRIGPGTHWVAYRNVDANYCEYFDPFGLSMSKSIQEYLRKSSKHIIYSGDEIQLRSSVLCGYWNIYFLYERQLGNTMLHTIHNQFFDMSNQHVNNRFIINYFKNL